MPAHAAAFKNPDQPDLDALYAPPAERIQKAVLDRLVDFHEAYLRKATFFCLATCSERGLDVSPRGGPPGFVHVLDAHTVAFADWPGNNRIESLRNLQRDERLAMVFLFPGLEIFLRIGSLRIRPIAIHHAHRFKYFVQPESSANADLLHIPQSTASLGR